MKLLKIITLLVIFIGNTSLFAQANIKSVNLKKGQILDILMLTTKPETEKAFEKYRKTAFPVAFKRSYKPLPGFRIIETTQGNIQPTSFIFGQWSDLNNREKFISEIETVVPDFHEQRRTIWSIFNLVYYEMPEDLSFSMDKNKYNVVTAYWKKDNSSFDAFTKQWFQKSVATGGKTVLKLTNGKSPAGYYYNPDLLVVTEWESKKEFESFMKDKGIHKNESVLHVNQFVIN